MQSVIVSKREIAIGFQLTSYNGLFTSLSLAAHSIVFFGGSRESRIRIACLHPTNSKWWHFRPVISAETNSPFGSALCGQLPVFFSFCCSSLKDAYWGTKSGIISVFYKTGPWIWVLVFRVSTNCISVRNLDCHSLNCSRLGNGVM